MLKLSSQAPQNVTLIRRKVIANVINLDEVKLEYGGLLIQNDFCPYKKNSYVKT